MSLSLATKCSYSFLNWGFSFFHYLLAGVQVSLVHLVYVVRAFTLLNILLAPSNVQVPSYSHLSNLKLLQSEHEFDVLRDYFLATEF